MAQAAAAAALADAAADDAIRLAASDRLSSMLRGIAPTPRVLPPEAFVTMPRNGEPLHDIGADIVAWAAPYRLYWLDVDVSYYGNAEFAFYKCWKVGRNLYHIVELDTFIAREDDNAGEYEQAVAAIEEELLTVTTLLGKESAFVRRHDPTTVHIYSLVAVLDEVRMEAWWRESAAAWCLNEYVSVLDFDCSPGLTRFQLHYEFEEGERGADRVSMWSRIKVGVDILKQM